MTTKSDMLGLIVRRGPLTDSELAHLLGVAHQQANQAARGLAAAGAIRRIPGADGVLLNHLANLDATPPNFQGRSARSRISPSARRWPVLGPVAGGTNVAAEDLTGLGFVEHKLESVPSADVPEGGLIGWNTLGAVPDAPGLYCFVGQQHPADGARVFYVGMTSHLWMVTKGQLPGGLARGGQRYGRPKHAGTTRQRINAEVARLTAVGWTFSHWLQAVDAPPHPATLTSFLHDKESGLIERWNLRVVGWNRG